MVERLYHCGSWPEGRLWETSCTSAACGSNASRGPTRQAFLENFDTPIRFGVHSGIKKFYRAEPDEEVPATLDHIVAAVGA